jgi:hypothetical protein
MKKYLPTKLYTRILSISLVLMSLFSLSASAQSTLCSSNGLDQTYEWVTRIKINDGTRTSGKTGYADFTSSAISTLTAGQTYNVEIDVRTNDTAWHEYVKLWLDLNQDNIIQDPQELIFVQDATVNPFLTFTGTVTIPTTAFNGSMIGRMIMQYAASPSLCGAYTYGTTYDVKVNILGGNTNPVNKTLTVSTIGSGTGSITSSPEGINTASGVNSFDFPENTNVALTAISDVGSTFLNWSGAVSSTSTNVVVNLNSDKNISANFNYAVPPPIAIITASGPTTVCSPHSVLLTVGTASSYQWLLNNNAISGAISNSYAASQSGSYTVVVTNSVGVAATSVAIVIAVNTLPEVTITTNGPTTFCPSESVTLSASAGSSYLWSTGATTQSINVATSGNYSVTVTNASGCVGVSSTTTIIAEDNEAPFTPVLADVTGECTATATAPTTTDNCSGVITGTTSNSLTYSTQGTHTITWSFDDGNGNIITANQNVIVKDTTVPIIPVLADVNGQCDATASVPAATDNCLGTINGTTSDPLTYAAQGTHVITWSFDDGNGNAITANQNVIVNDTIAPTAITQDITVTLDEYGNATITAADIDNGSSDNCTYTPSIDVTTFDCTNIDINNTVTLTVIDAAGNTDITTANVTILEHFKETLDLRSLSSFEAFTGTGAVTNSGNFTGNVGTNVGALTGFTGPNFNGSIHFNDALTAQAELDLLKVYIHLNNIPVTHPNANNAAHAPAFGSGEVLTPGVYDIGGAGSVAGTLTLNGQGDQNAVFIMKFKGAFTAGAGSNIVLTNGADAANVFWVAQGALSVGANSVIKGTLLAYPGAITLGVNSSIEGRLLSSVGAITVGVGGTATMPGTMNIPINPMISYTPAAAVDVLGSIENFSLFTSNGAVANASTSGILGDVGADVGAISGFATSAHIGSFYSADPVTAQAKIDLNNAYTQLMSIPTTVPNHTPAFGSGEILQPGVYSTPGAGSLAGIVTLDGQNNPDAIFIFKFNGAFAAAAQSKVILSNGTRRCNVFWISEGAASIGSFSTLKGTILAHNGAATMGAGGNLEGRLLSTGGAIGFSTGVVYTVVHDVECDTSTAQKTAVKTAVDTETISFEEELQVYPNPSKGIFNIKLSTVNVQTDIYLFDTTGKLIVRKSISKENNSGDLIRIGNNNLSSGIYLVKIITNNKAVTKKVIVEKR